MSTIEEQLRSELISSLNAAGAAPGDRFLLGFSGGPDSLCLACLCASPKRGGRLSRTGPDYRLEENAALAHLDHGIRPREEREREALLVKSFAGELGLPLFTGALEEGGLAERARREGRSLEDLAREERMVFFRRLMEQQGFTWLLLGHHLDDQMETLVMRFFQGSGISGLKGMTSPRGSIIRPLLRTEKRLITAYLAEKGLRPAEDSTNSGDDYLRNKIRHRLLPLAEEIFPGYRTALENFRRKMEGLEEFLLRERQTRLDWRDQGDHWICDAAGFFSAPRILQLESLYELYDRSVRSGGGENSPPRRLPYRFLETLKNPRPEKPREILLRGYGFVLIKRKNLLFWERDIVISGKNGYLIPVNGSMEYSVGDIRFLFQKKHDTGLPGGVIFLKREELEFPFLFRSRESGDSLEFSAVKASGGKASGDRAAEGGTTLGRTAGESKSLKKLFSSWKIPEEDRWKIPVLEDRRGIFGVIGAPWGGKNCFSRGLAEEPAGGRCPEETFSIAWEIGSC